MALPTRTMVAPSSTAARKSADMPIDRVSSASPSYLGAFGRPACLGAYALGLRNLLLITGDIDNNVHPANTYRLADALIKANKRFDFLIIPGQRHGYTSAGPYVNQRRADYFCRYLLGNTEESVDIVELNREQQQTGARAR